MAMALDGRVHFSAADLLPEGGIPAPASSGRSGRCVHCVRKATGYAAMCSTRAMDAFDRRRSPARAARRSRERGRLTMGWGGVGRGCGWGRAGEQ